MQTTVVEDAQLINELSAMAPEDILSWALTNHGPRAALFTSFQDTGCVMMDMAHKIAPELRVVTIDTLRLHPETYALIEEVEKRYGISVERYTPDPDRLERMVAQHGLYLFFDSKAKQEYCCQIRKVEPNIRAMRTVDVWITGLRRDQSEGRQDVPKASIEPQEWGKVIKLAPLADWDQSRVRSYLAEHDVPYNRLYDQGYSSIGCIMCSTPTLPHEDVRAGRWRWFNDMDDPNKECGIHSHSGGGGI